MKRILALLMSAAMTCALLAGCGGNTPATTAADKQGTVQQSTAAEGTPAAPTQETVKFKYVVPGTAPKDYDLVAAEINKKLKADGVGIELERTYIPWDAWTQKINLMLSTGEEFDMFHVMQDLVPYSTYLAKGAITDLTGPLAKYGSNISKVIPQDIWAGAQSNGKTYVIPTFWVEMASEGEFDIRMDLLKQNNLDMPKTPDELLNAEQTVMKNWKGKNKPYIPFRPDFDPVGIHSTILHRTYDSFPFTVRDKFFYVNQNGDVKSWIETPEFKKDSEFMRKAYKAGLINPDVLTIKQEQFNAQLDNGDWLMCFGTAGNLKALQKNNPAATGDDVQAVYFNSDKPYLRPMTIKNCNAVPTTSKHPESAVKFMNWLWTNQDNYDLYFYGIEGKHFKKVGDHGIEWINDPNNNNAPDYQDSDWMAGNINFIRYDNVNGIPSNNKVLFNVNEKAQNSIAANFLFDPTNVKAEYANIQTEAAASIVPIYMGVVDYDKAFPAALEKMKKAGLDKVVAEYQRQFQNWKSNSGK